MKINNSIWSILSLKSLKTLLSLLLFLLLPALLAANPDSLFIKGNEYYMQRQYEMAEQCYSAIAASGYESADLYYNLGNALYKQEKLAPAILYYEKALVLKPGDEDIRENLALANTRIIDKIEAIPEFFVRRWINALRGLFSPDTWAVIGIVLFISGLAVIVISYLRVGERLRKASLGAGLVFVCLSLISLLLMSARIKIIMKHEHAIIMTSSVTARSSPDEQSTNVFVLHEGTKVQVTDSIQSWKEIRIANGNTGWVPGESLARI